MGIPLFKEKLEFLCTQFGINQQQLANAIGVDKAAITQWKTDGIPKARIHAVGKYFGIDRDTFELADFVKFVGAVKHHLRGTRWKAHAQNARTGGLKIQVKPSAAMLKGIYPEPRNVREDPNEIKVTVGDGIVFKLAKHQAGLPDNEALAALILVIENPSDVQILTLDWQDPNQLLSADDHYCLPNSRGNVYYCDYPTGRHQAYLILSACVPPKQLWTTFAQHPDGHAADQLAAWLVCEKVTHIIRTTSFLVNA